MESFVFYKSFFEGINALPEEAQAKAYAAICKYALFGETPEPGGLEYVIFIMAKAQIDANNKRREAGRKGGEAKQTEAMLDDPVKQKKATRKQKEATSKQNEAMLDFASTETEEPGKQTEANVNVNVNVNENVNNNTPRASDAALGKEFESLWLMYPRKEGHDAAKKAYITARKSKVLQTTMEEVKKGLEAYCAKIEAEGTEKRYIMQGSTFFRGRRWTDDFVINIPQNKFSQGMETHDYDWDALERELI